MRGVARRVGWAALGGVLLYAGHPPWDQAWAGYVAVAPLLALARDVATGRRAALRGFGWGTAAGLVFFLPLLTWISRFGIAAWLLLALLEAVFVGAFVAVVAGWGARRWRAVVAVVAWVAFEWLRSSVPLDGFPWGVLAYTQHDGGPVLPVARLLGVFGVSAVLAAMGVAVEAAGLAVARLRSQALIPPVVAVVGLVLLLAVVVPSPPAPTGETVDIAAVQGNDQELPPFVDRENTGRVIDIASRMAEATVRFASEAEDLPDIVVWPENALDDDPGTNPLVGEQVRRAQAALGDATLLAGTLLDGDRPATFRNTIVRFGPDADVAEVYDKRILVPFGEYVPWRSVLGGLPPLQALPSDGVPGTEPMVFDIDGVLVGPITCYESIFARLVRDQVRAGAEVLVVSTNNASFGRTPAAAQHLAFSQVRAVETGRWVLQAGISGISAVIDQHGRTSQETELFTQAVVRDELPLVEEDTAFVRAGDIVGPAAGAGLLVIGGLLLIGGRRRSASDGAAERRGQMADATGGR